MIRSKTSKFPIFPRFHSVPHGLLTGTRAASYSGNPGTYLEPIAIMAPCSSPRGPRKGPARKPGAAEPGVGISLQGHDISPDFTAPL
eukprot:927916-Pyramimonas_sp.AAC.1